MSQKNAIEFWSWFDGARRHTSIRELERLARAPRGRIGNPYSEQRQPTALVCRSIAQALGVSPDVVLEKAGHLPSTPGNDEETVKNLIYKIRNMSEEERSRMVDYAEFITFQRDRDRAGKRPRSPSPSEAPA